MQDADITIDATRRAALIEAILNKLQSYYIFPDVAPQGAGRTWR